MSAPRRVLVIGHRGYYGARVAAAVARIPHVEVYGGGRRETSGDHCVQIDLLDASSFAALADFDLIVNASDTVGAPPDELIRHCLEAGLTLLEMGADPALAERALAIGAGQGARGRVLLGVGVFPGLSTALACSLARQLEAPEAIHLGVRISPLSGAGKANVALMVHSLLIPSVWWEAGERREGPTVGRRRALPFFTGEHPAAVAPLPDAALIRAATDVPEVAAHMGLSPSLMLWSFSLTAVFMRILGPLRGLAAKLMGLQLWLMRAVLLRRRSSPVDLVAVVRDAGGGERTRSVWFDDGQEATAYGVAGFARLCLDAGAELGLGVHPAGELFEIDRLLEVVGELAGGDLTVKTSTPS